MDSRLEALQKYYQEEPNDPFNGYALALEVARFSKEKALKFMLELLDKFPDYVPLYYQSAVLSLELGLNVECQPILLKGIAVATSTNDAKAAREMRALLLEVEGEI